MRRSHEKVNYRRGGRPPAPKVIIADTATWPRRHVAPA
jgi:hypothetical protein